MIAAHHADIQYVILPCRRSNRRWRGIECGAGVGRSVISSSFDCDRYEMSLDALNLDTYSIRVVNAIAQSAPRLVLPCSAYAGLLRH